MAIIKCPECRQDISDKANQCPNCGCPQSLFINKNNEIEKEETKYISVCQCCSNINFTSKIRIDNTIKSNGYPTCMFCGGKIKVLVGKNEWMKKSRIDRDSILKQEILIAQNSSEYKSAKAKEYGNLKRPDIDVQGYCPKCANYYPMSSAIRKGIDNCEFCGTKIKYSNILTEDFTEMFNEHMQGKVPHDSDIGAFIIEYFLANEPEFSEVFYNKRLNPEQYVDKQMPNKQNMPKCVVCGSTNIKKISSTSKAVKIGFFGIFGAIDDAGKQWKCTHCGSKF